MMHTIARYYNTPERMTTLFCKVTNQMIQNARQFLEGPGKLWDQDKPTLLTHLEQCLKLNEQYQEQYRLTRDRLQAQPKGKQFDFNEQKIFGKSAQPKSHACASSATKMAAPVSASASESESRQRERGWKRRRKNHLMDTERVSLFRQGS